jgi:hypothetical protein
MHQHFTRQYFITKQLVLEQLGNFKPIPGEFNDTRSFHKIICISVQEHEASLPSVLPRAFYLFALLSRTRRHAAHPILLILKAELTLHSAGFPEATFTP